MKLTYKLAVVFMASVLFLALTTVSGFAQTLLYQWNFDNAITTGGTNLSVAPTTIDSADGYVGGNLVSAWDADGSLSTPPASGVYGSTTSTDLGLYNSAPIATQGGALVGGVGDLSGVTNHFTATLWFNLGANYQFAKNGRFFEIDSRVANNGTTVGNQAASADGNEFYFAFNSSGGSINGIQIGVSSGQGTGTGSGHNSPNFIWGTNAATTDAIYASSTNIWYYIAVVYTNGYPAAGSSSFLIYVGTTNSPATLVQTLTDTDSSYNVNGLNTVVGVLNAGNHWATTNVVEIGNRAYNGQRPFPGTLDKVRLYKEGLTLAQVQADQGVFSPPAITVQPTPDAVFPGANPAFSVVASGSVPFAYQWKRNGTNLIDGGNISGSATGVLKISNVSTADVFTNYQVVITNVVGSVTSTPVSLSLIVTNGAYQRAALTNQPFAYYSFSETNDPSVGGVTAYDSFGAFNGTYGVASQNGFNGIVGPQTTADGLPGFPDGNTALATAGANSQVTVPAFNLNNGNGTNVLTIAAWIYPNGQQPNAAGIVFCRGGSTTAGIAYLDNNPNNYLGYNWANDGNNYNWNSGLVPPPNVWSLVALVVTPTNATLYICNTNNGLLSATHVYPHVVQRFDAPTLIGFESYNASRVFNGSIDEVALFGQALTRSQVASLFTTASGLTVFPPTIVADPTWNPATIYVGQPASIAINAQGTASLSYQWMAGAVGSGLYTNLPNGGNISGATTATLTITNAQLSNYLDYVVRVSNAYGAVTSTVPATLTINDSAPFLVTDTTPNPATYYAGFTVTLSAAFDGSRPIAYQWVTDGGSGTYTNVPGATNSTLVISNVQAGNGGNYYLNATNLAGAASSSATFLSVVDSTYAIHFGATNFITTADAVLNQGGYVMEAATFGGTSYLVTLTNGNSINFVAGGSAASANGNGISYDGFNTAADYNPGQTTGNANFDQVLNEYSWDGGPKNISVENLVPGHQYSVLLIGLDDNTTFGYRTAYFQDPLNPTDVSSTFIMSDNVYVVATFTAQTTTQTIIEQLPTGNNGNINALVVYDLSAVVTPPTLSITPSGGGHLTLTWSAGSMLLQATNLLGPWTTNSTAASPYTVSPTNAQNFFRVRTP